MRDFQRVAIVNRGEAAMRLIHAVREIVGQQGGRTATVALYTDPDQRAMFVREADFAVGLGPATFVDPKDGRRKSAYLDYARLERALVEAKADAAWVGWGFVSEHAEFAELCARLGITFIGPSPGVMRKLADKITAKRLAEQAGLPVSPWSGGPVETLAEAREKAAALGYPLMLKASAGGGGRGIRAVGSEEELAATFDRARAEALAAFGDATVFLERRVSGARHIEVQMLGDHHGNAWAVGVRDCTIQRRHQKVLEEAPSPALSPEQDRELRASAARLAKLVGYENAGTVEFLYDPEAKRFAFMEVNARLQVEHPVTEETTGLDLVKLQIHIARGGRLEGEPPAPVGHAIEVRLNAEDPENEFAPAPGRIEMLRLPTGPGLRVDRGVTEGDVVPPEFDSMIAKLIAWGRDRDEALARLRRALAEAAIAIRGGSSNKAFLLGLLARPEVRASEVDNAWLDGLAARGEHISREHAEVALLVAATEAYQAELSVERAQFYASAARGRPKLRGEVGRTVELRHRGRDYRLKVLHLAPHAYRVDAGGGAALVRMERLGPFERRLVYAGRSHRVLVVAQDTSYLIEVDGVPHRVFRDAGGIVRSPTPAMVLSIAVQPGAEVEAGARLATLEAMKMEMAVTAPFAGRVREVLVTANVQVDAGAPLLRLEPLGTERAEGAEEPLRFEAAPRAEDDARARWARAHEELRRLLLGFDMDAAYAKRFVGEWERCCAALPPDDPELMRAEEDALALFVDLHSLFRQKPAEDDPDGPSDQSPREYLLAYLRALDVRGEGLPASFLGKLGRTLAHYGIESLDRTPELEDSLVRIYKAHDRGELLAAAVAAILERWLGSLSEREGDAGDRLRVLLERIIAVTQGRFPTVGDLAREVRYRVFEQAGFERARDAVYAEMDACLARLAAGATGTARAEEIATLVDCPQPLVRGLIERFEHGTPLMRELMLEVLTRRYYRIRNLERIAYHTVGAQSVFSTAYDHEGRRVHAFATHATLPRLTEAVAALAGLCADVPPDHDIVLDVHAWSAEPLAGPEVTVHAVRSALDAAALPRPLRRVVVIVGDPTTTLRTTEPASARQPGQVRRISRAQYFTFRPARGVTARGYEEDKVYRGLHPMMGKRMHLWRLSNFDIERLPSAEHVFLFHARGRENPKDERLFAVAEVRDFTPVRDAAGRVVSLPYLERMLLETLASIRLFQARRAPHERLQWNRVLLYAWQPLDLSPRELVALVRRLAPATEGLGLEQVLVHARVPDRATRTLKEQVLRITATVGHGLQITLGAPSETPLRIISEYEQKVTQLRRRGLVYPYEIVRLLTPAKGSAAGDHPHGVFVEHDLHESGRLVPVDRPHGQNKAHIVAGVITSFTKLHPEGLTRVILLGDPSKEMGSVAEPECRRIMAAIDLAEQMRVPVDWFTLSAGAKISMASGTENMDWIAAALRRIVEFTQAGGEINVVVCGVNVGAQPYWNAEATMLMHTRGILVMTPEAAMVLTGKQALDYSGSVSAEDNQGIGGYHRIMGPNGQAQYWAEDLGGACRILLAHHEHTWVVPGERFPRRARTTDPIDRDIRLSPHAVGEGFSTIGDVFSDEKNPGRKRPFDVRAVMGAVIDRDHAPLERWKEMRDAETAVVWDARVGGHAVCMIGIESRPVRRLGFVPADGPEQWSAGTLFPRSSKKVARAINGASNNRPVVVLANLSGFDGSPESMRNLQLEYGAEIGRSIVNFRGPIVFCVISRYHGGAFVVFSKRLNEGFEAAAIEGSYASVIGGAPAAAVVFARDVDTRTAKDARIAELDGQIAKASGEEKRRLSAKRAEQWPLVRSEKLGEVAEEFDRVHSVHRAKEVGSLDSDPAAGAAPAVPGGGDRARDHQGSRRRVSMGTRTLILGAVSYDPKVVTIWEGFKRWFEERDLPFDFVLYSNYERQVEAHLAGHIDVAWNSPLAWIEADRAARARGRTASAIAMRDTDRDLTSVIVVREASEIRSVADLRGKVVGAGAGDSPQATLIPLLHVAEAGLAPERDFSVRRFDVLLGKHGDHIGGERDAARALVAGEVDAACLIDANHLAFVREGTLPAGGTRLIAQTAPYDHCNFTILDGAPGALIERFTALLFGMSYADPVTRPLMDMEGLKAWLPGRVEGYAQLERAVDRFDAIGPWLRDLGA
ncbi:MAG: biotin carboxylase N-terminal domain-containing protein [Minicystis sp.]